MKLVIAGPFFLSVNVIPAKITNKLLWLVLPDGSLGIFFIILHRRIFCMGKGTIKVMTSAQN